MGKIYAVDFDGTLCAGEHTIQAQMEVQIIT